MQCTVRWGLPLLLLVAVACGDDPVGPDRTEGVLRTVVFHRQDTGENLLLNSDGSSAGALSLPGSAALPVAVSASGYTMAVYQGSVVGLVRLDRPDHVDTIITPRPGIPFLGSFSRDAQFLALITFSPTIAVLVFDRANRTVDTLPYTPGADASGGVVPVLPPVFSPDNEQIVVVGASVLSLFSTVLHRTDRSRRDTQTFGFSRFQTIPVLGWPRWTADEGLLMAFVREGQAQPDTLLSVSVDPHNPVEYFERFRAVLSPVSDERPELIFGDFSTYAYAENGEAIVIGAHPGTGSSGRHALYYMTPSVPRVVLLLDDPAQVPVLPNFIN